MDALQPTIRILSVGISNALNFYVVLLLIRVLLTWFPSIDWSRSPFSLLSSLTDPYLNIFRRFIPTLGPIDISPIIAIFAIQILAGLITYLFNVLSFTSLTAMY